MMNKEQFQAKRLIMAELHEIAPIATDPYTAPLTRQEAWRYTNVLLDGLNAITAACVKPEIIK